MSNISRDENGRLSLNGFDLTPEEIKEISKSAEDSYFYSYVTRKRFEAGEEAISKNPHLSFCYADILGERWVKGEKAIATDARSSFFYAVYVLGGRFEAGEEVINKSPFHKKAYEEFLDLKTRVREISNV